MLVLRPGRSQRAGIRLTVRVLRPILASPMGGSRRLTSMQRFVLLAICCLVAACTTLTDRGSGSNRSSTSPSSTPRIEASIISISCCLAPGVLRRRPPTTRSNSTATKPLPYLPSVWKQGTREADPRFPPRSPNEPFRLDADSKPRAPLLSQRRTNRRRPQHRRHSLERTRSQSDDPPAFRVFPGAGVTSSGPRITSSAVLETGSHQPRE
jgi:hypothetical protein